MAISDEENWYDAKPVETKRRDGKTHSPEAPASLGQIDQEIYAIQKLLGDRTQEQYEAYRAVVRHKRNWLSHRDRQVKLSIARHERTSEDVRDMLARTEFDEHGTHGLKLWERLEDAEEFQKALSSEVKALQSRLSALQSVGNHVYRATGG